MQIDHIFLDMDGVLTDFVNAALRLHGRIDVLGDWPRGERDVPKVLGISRGAFWRKIDTQGSDFWASLEPYPWFGELVDLVRQTAPLTVLTTPSLAPHCLEGKVRWLYEHFPIVQGRRFTDFLIGKRKHLLAQPRRLLIDDLDPNVEAFRSAGGQAILFPQIWNRNHDVGDPLAYVRSQISMLAEKDLA